jgi:HEPN domain-containing protein
VWEWVQKAEDDFEAARDLLRRRKRPLPDQVCFHAQQAAEKYLKALLTHNRVEFAKTHDLLELLGLALRVEPGLEVLREELSILNPFAVLTRYPGGPVSVTPEDARRAMAAIKRIRKHLRAVLERRI